MRLKSDAGIGFLFARQFTICPLQSRALQYVSIFTIRFETREKVPRSSKACESYRKGKINFDMLEFHETDLQCDYRTHAQIVTLMNRIDIYFVFAETVGNIG